MAPSASPLGVGTSSTSLVSDEDPRATAIMDPRKRKRMISNRDSARRSRMRKQKRLDDLAAEAGQLAEENQRVRTSLKVVVEGYVRVEYDNSVLRTQMEELGQRLKSLEEIVRVLGGLWSFGSDGGYQLINRDFAFNNQIC